MYNKCSKCGKLIDSSADTRLVPGTEGETMVLCLRCYDAAYGVSKE